MEDIILKLCSNGFDACFAKTKEEALKIALSKVDQSATIGFGGSMSVEQIGLRAILIDMEKQGKVTLFNPYREGISREESLLMRHKGMQADCFITGTNAITESGELVNVDGYGNRVAAQICGPKKVIIVAGKNKVVADIAAAVIRTRNVAAPLNAKRLNKDTPCVKTGRCMDCSSADRICNFTTIIHKSRPQGRICVILVDEELGL